MKVNANVLYSIYLQNSALQSIESTEKVKKLIQLKVLHTLFPIKNYKKQKKSKFSDEMLHLANCYYCVLGFFMLMVLFY